MTRTSSSILSVAAPNWRKLLVAACLLTLVAIPTARGIAQVGGETDVVDDVLIVGLQRLALQQVKAQLSTIPGRPYNPGTVQEDLVRLGKMATFKSPRADVQPVPGKRAVKVTFFVEEYPTVVREVVYKNNHHMAPEDLDKITGINRDLPLNPASNRAACQRIVDHYKREGRFFASCQLEEGNTIGDTRVVFNITEGPVVRCRNINFTGNNTLASDARLRTQIDTWQRYLYVDMFGSKFNPLAIDQDAAKLQLYYRSNGYIEAQVTRALRFTDDHQYVDVTFHISEGPRFHVQDVTIKGATLLPQDQVQSILKLHKDDYYDEHVIEADMRNITDLYGHRGYPVGVKREWIQTPEKTPGVVRVQYEIFEQKPAKTGYIYISGNEVTRQEVIFHYLTDILPGQPLNYPALRAAEARLARSNLFDMQERPTVTVIEDNGLQNEYKDILVRVKETMTGSLMFGASVNSDAGLVGSIVLNERNFDITRLPRSFDDILEGKAFRGGGQELRIEAVPGTQVQRYSISFREPFLFDLPYSLTTSAYYFDRSYVEYLESRLGFNVAVGHQFTRTWSGSVGMRVENVNVSHVPFFAPPEFLEVQGDNLLVAPRVTVARDDRDNFIRPTDGSSVSLTYEQLLGDFISPIVTLEGSKFFTTYQRADGSGKHVLALRSQVSWAGDDTPVYEKFYAGGIRSLRGFEFRGVGPIENGFNLGGEFMFLNSLEYQVPILANDMVYLVGFVDSGTVEKSVGINDYRVSAGVGARIQIPMLGQVPIAIDFGFPIVRGANDREQIFSFYVGFFGNR